MSRAKNHHLIEEEVCVTIWRGPTVQQSRKSLDVSIVRRPRHGSTTNNRQQIIWLDDAFWIGRETSPVKPVSPVDQIILIYILFYLPG